MNKLNKNISKAQREEQMRIRQNRKLLGHYTVIGSFLGLVTLILTLLVYFSTRQELEIKLNTKTFFALFDVIRQEGFQRFIDEKQVLKSQVNRTLQAPANEEEEEIASTIAVYLFPDSLPDSNFEKTIAMEQWAPLEAAIEKSPRTAESRLWFEEMRANIWNYENPKLGAASLSPYAKEVLRIYNELSSP